jgi:Na+/H+ antiporter NhaD/arsenite permease-like protein
VRLSIIDSILAALFTNDVACVILTPLILKKWIEQSRDKNELNTLLLALATQANIGKLDSMNFSYDSFITFRKYIDDFW